MQPQDQFVEAVCDFLLHLHDYGYLQTSPLVRLLATNEQAQSVQAMRSVRARLLTTLEQFNPGASVAFRSPHARTYNVLKLHYVERLTVLEVAHELAISERTVYRELRKAEYDLAVLLWGSHQAGGEVVNAMEKMDDEPVLQEVKRIEESIQDVELSLLLPGILGAVDKLSHLRQVAIDAPIPTENGVRTVISVDPLLLRQMLINVLSHLIQSSEPGTRLSIHAHPEPYGAKILLCRSAAPLLNEKDYLPAAAQQLLQRMNAGWSVNVAGDGCLQVELHVGGPSPYVVLVIDDNENLLELFRRYLADEGYSIIGASDGRAGLQWAIENVPDVVILDVMMPQHDGWEVLQWFQTRDGANHIPVIICSVLNDPELAYSLGAAGFIPKPVARQDLLSTLARYRGDDSKPSRRKLPVDSRRLLAD